MDGLGLKKTYFVLGFLLSLIIFCNNSYAEETHKVLFLESGYINSSLGADISQGLRDELGSDNIKLIRDYIDIYDYNDKEFMQKVYELYRTKYKNEKVDLVVSLEESASTFLSLYGRDIFGEIPMVIGLDYSIREEISRNFKGYDKQYNIYMEADIVNNVNLIKKIMPKSKNIIFYFSETEYDTYYTKKIKEINKLYKNDNINLIVISEKDIDKAIKKINDIEESVVFVMATDIEEDGRRANISDYATRFKREIIAPIFVPISSGVELGATGGYVINFKKYGQYAGRYCKNILSDRDKVSKKVFYGEKEYLFNYNMMVKNNIAFDILPKDSSYINSIINYYKVPRSTFIMFLALIILILMIVIYHLLRSIEKANEVEENLKENLKLLQVFIETIPNPFYYRDLEGKYVSCNKAFCEFMNLDKEQIIGKHMKDLFKEDYIEKSLDKDEQLFKSKKTITYEDVIVSGQGNETAVIMYKSTFTDKYDDKAGVLGVVLDITNRKKIEEFLKESKERYRSLLNSIPYSIALLHNEKVEFVNDKACELFKVKDSSSLVGRYFYEFMDEEDVQMTRDRFKSVVEDRCQLPLQERRYKTADGSYVDVEITTMPYEENGKIKILTIANDISERRQNEKLTKTIEEAREQDRIKTEFFANLSHELRTPLNVILGSIQLIEQDNKKRVDSTYKGSKRIQVLKQNCHRLLRLVNNLIDITKLDAGYFHMSFKNYNIVNIVEDITLSVVEYVEQKGLHIIFDTDVEEKIVFCDPDALERIMLNLISNSIKFSNAGTTIEVVITDEDDYINIAIKDNGIGIEKEKLGEIFKRFRQVDKSFRRRQEGSGIGLSLVKYLVELHEGHIDVESKYNVGTTFNIKLPVEKNAHEDFFEESVSEDIIESRVERVSIEFSDIYS